MGPLLTFFLLALAALGLAGAQTRPTPATGRADKVSEAAVPVHEEPRHRLAYENSLVRVLDVSIGPGEASLYHLHADRILGVVIDEARTWQQLQGRDASAPSLDDKVGQIIDNSKAELPYTHRVGNADSVGIRYVVGVLRAPSGIDAPALGAEAGLALDRETAGGRVYRVRLAPGEATPAHRHAQPGLTVQVGAGTVRLEGAAPEAASPQPGPGAWWWRPAGASHVVRNNGATSVEVVEIDWK
jgi:quercetin dioxygenase-like cupin family protein